MTRLKLQEITSQLILKRMINTLSVTVILTSIFILQPYALFGQSSSGSINEQTTVTTSYKWINMYENRYGNKPEKAQSLPTIGTTVVEYNPKTLDYVRTLYYSKQPLSSIKPKISRDRKYYSIEFSDWSKQIIRNDISGEYDTIKDFAVIIGPDASVIRLFEDVVGLKWLGMNKVFIMQGVPIEGCPDYHLDKMFIFNVETQIISKVIDNTLFCGSYPEFKDSKIIFPCCNSNITQEYLWDSSN